MCADIQERSGDLRSPVEMVASLTSIGFTTKERLALCLKPRYQLRRLRNKGAILVLIWNFLLMKSYYFIDFESSQKFSKKQSYIYLYIIPGCMGIIMPLAGWLSDVRFGRYRIIYWSILIMWVSSVLMTVSGVVVDLLKLSKSVHREVLLYTLSALSVLLGVGYSCLQANIIQFGVDQLTDCSTTELISFIYWYIFSFVGSQALAYLLFNLAQIKSSLISLILCASMSAIAISMFLFKRVLIKEPVTRNPFKLIYNVLKYASKTKYPQRRSAFTYCEDELPSRLDFGKLKYGGPFTTEQVEDVKTCLRLIGLLVLLSLVYGMSEENVLKLSINPWHKNPEKDTGKTSWWWSDFFVKNVYSITGTLLIPLNEFLIHPLFQRCLPNIVSYWKVLIGIIIHLTRYIVLMVLITMVHHDYINTIDPTTNSTIQCIFSDKGVFLNHTIDYRWFSLPEVLSAISFVLIMVGTIEFYCAQVPYSMKGVVAGTFYGFFLLFHVVSNAMPKLFSLESSWKLGTLFGCEFWYLLTKVVLMVAVVTILMLALSCYKRRKREDVLPNEQIFAEIYYDTSVESDTE